MAEPPSEGVRRRPGAIRSALLVLLVCLAGAAALWGPGPLDVLGGRDLPSPLAGGPLPAVTQAPAVRVAVAGDTGTGDEHQWATARRMELEGRSDPYDALLLLGDLIYEDGDAALLGPAVTEPFGALTRTGTVLLPVLGNHDYHDGEQGQILAALGREKPWYAEDVGPLRVLVLDSNRVEDPKQTAWLREMLDRPAPEGTWTVAAMHHPPFSAGYHGSDTKVRKQWSPLFAAAGVPLVLAGHDHDYQRSTPQDGVTYVVSGAGAKLRRAGQASFTAVSTSTLHFLDLLVYPDRLVGRAVDQAGGLVDMFTITR